MALLSFVNVLQYLSESIVVPLGINSVSKTPFRSQKVVSKFIDGLAAEFFAEAFQKWITRQEKCVEKSGDYVEK